MCWILLEEKSRQMIHAYNKIYLNSVIHNIAAVFDLAINAESLTADSFAYDFSSSDVAKGIENGSPNMLSGKSAAELLTIILSKDIAYSSVAMNRTPEYWGGWILAYAQWYLNKSFSEILSVISFSLIVALYNPYHESDEMKMVEYIKELFPKVPALKRIRQLRKLTQKQLSVLSGVKLRSIQAYEQGDNDIQKAQAETLHLLAKTLDCTIEELLA